MAPGFREVFPTTGFRIITEQRSPEIYHVLKGMSYLTDASIRPFAASGKDFLAHGEPGELGALPGR